MLLSKGLREGMEHTFLEPTDSQSWYFIYRIIFGQQLLTIWIGKCLWEPQEGGRKMLLNAT